MRIGKYFLTSFIFIAFSCSKPQAPDYLGIRDLQLGKISMQESVISAKLAFYNPNTFNLQLKKAEMDVFLNDKLANHYIFDSTMDIPKKDTFLFPLQVTISPQQLLGNALQILMNNNQVKIRLEGSARVKRSGISFNVPIHFEQMQKLDLGF